MFTLLVVAGSFSQAEILVIPAQRMALVTPAGICHSPEGIARSISHLAPAFRDVPSNGKPLERAASIKADPSKPLAPMIKSMRFGNL
jgi:hypothetical protein